MCLLLFVIYEVLALLVLGCLVPLKRRLNNLGEMYFFSRSLCWVSFFVPLLFSEGILQKRYYTWTKLPLNTWFVVQEWPLEEVNPNAGSRLQCAILCSKQPSCSWFRLINTNCQWGFPIDPGNPNLSSDLIIAHKENGPSSPGECDLNALVNTK